MANKMMWFIITMVCAFIPGLIVHRTKLPLGGTIGAMIGVAILNLLTGNATYLDPLRNIIMIMAGAMIGSCIGREELKQVKKLFLAIVMVIVVMVAFNLVLGGTIYAFSNLDAATSLFAVQPGGGTELAIVSEEMGANPTYVGILQIVRGMLFVLIAPLVFSVLIKSLEKKGTKIKTRARYDSYVRGGATELKAEVPDNIPVSFHYHKSDVLRLGGLFTAAAIGGLLFSKLGVAAGILIGGVLFAAVYSVIFGKAVYPKKVIPVQQVLAGAYLGLSVNKEAVASMGELIVPIVIMTIGMIIFALISGFIMFKITKMDLITSLLAASPCGVAELALVSEELGADTSIVGIVQTMRFVIVVSTFPLMLSAIIQWIG